MNKNIKAIYKNFYKEAKKELKKIKKHKKDDSKIYYMHNKKDFTL